MDGWTYYATYSPIATGFKNKKKYGLKFSK